MHGNRDFLLGEAFARQSGCHLIDDPSIIELDGQRVLLSHGDQLCTDDHDYQAFRQQVRSQTFQREFLSLAIEQRQHQARQYREQSKTVTRLKAQDIMDVNTGAVRQLMQQFDVDCLIHGHTHRPAIHQLPDKQRRIVLGDWGTTGSVLIHDNNGLNLHSFDATTLTQLADSIAA